MRLLCKALVLSVLLTAQIAVAAEEPPPHLFNDLNGNGRIDAEEEQGHSSSANNGQIEEIVLPDTPPEEGDGTITQ